LARAITAFIPATVQLRTFFNICKQFGATQEKGIKAPASGLARNKGFSDVTFKGDNLFAETLGYSTLERDLRFTAQQGLMEYEFRLHFSWASHNTLHLTAEIYKRALTKGIMQYLGFDIMSNLMQTFAFKTKLAKKKGLHIVGSSDKGKLFPSYAPLKTGLMQFLGQVGRGYGQPDKMPPKPIDPSSINDGKCLRVDSDPQAALFRKIQEEHDAKSPYKDREQLANMIISCFWGNHSGSDGSEKKGNYFHERSAEKIFDKLAEEQPEFLSMVRRFNSMLVRGLN